MPEKNLSKLGLSRRTIGVLRRAGIENAEQLVKISGEELRKLRGLGPKTFGEIERILEMDK